jgi:hypothetical protein
MIRLLLLAVGLLAGVQADGPEPLGPRDVALCPVTGQNMTIADMYPLGLIGGQMLWFSTKDAASQYGRDPRSFWRVSLFVAFR